MTYFDDLIPQAGRFDDLILPVRAPLFGGEPTESDFGESLERASQESFGTTLSETVKKMGAADLYSTSAYTVGLINRANEWMTENWPAYARERDEGFGPELEDWLIGAARRTMPRNQAEDFLGKVREGLIHAPLDVAMYMSGTKALGTIPGMAAVETLRAEPETLEEAGLAAAKGGTFGAALKGTERLGMGPRAVGLGAVGGAAAAGEGGDVEDVAASAATLAILGLAGPVGGTRFRDLIPAAKESIKADLESLQPRGDKLTPRVEPSLEVPEVPRETPPDPAPAVQPKARPQRVKPLSILEFVSKQGGIVENDTARGNLRAMDAHLWHREKPFRARLVREDGRDLDYMRERAQEAGYLEEGSVVDDLLRLMDAELRGERQPAARDIGVEREKTEAEDKAEIDADRARAIDELGLNTKGLSLDQIDNLIVDTYANLQGMGGGVIGMREPVRTGATREYLKRIGKLEETDQGDQFVLPGGERISQKELLTRKMQGRKGSEKEQKPADEGLFDDTARQPDLVDIAKKGEGPVGMQVPAGVVGEAGSAYAGFIKGEATAKPGEVAREKPITRESVLQPLLKALNIPLYQGRIKKRSKMLGYFRPGKEEVRLKRKSDLEVAAHELAHLFDSRVFGGFKTDTARKPGTPEPIGRPWLKGPNAKVFAQELKSVSYDAKKVYEGFAEFVRHWATRPEIARKAAPKFYDYFEQLMDRHEYGPAFRKAQTDMQAWFAQDAGQRFRSKIGYAQDINDFTSTPYNRFRQWALDDVHGIARAEQDLFGALRPGGAYEAARLSRGAGGLVMGAVQFGPPMRMKDGRVVFVDRDGNPSTEIRAVKGKPTVGKNMAYKPWGLEEVLRPVADRLDDFGLYAVARRAEFLKGQGRENLFDQSEIEFGLSLETPEFRQTFENYNRFNSQVLDFAQQSGVIDPVGRKAWETAVYLPFWRVDKSNPRAHKSSGETKLIHRLAGGTGNIRDPIENMFQNVRLLIEASVANHARRAVVRDLEQAYGSGRFFTKIAKDEALVKVHIEEVQRALLGALGVKGEFGLRSLPVEAQQAITTVRDAAIEAYGPLVPFVQRGVAPKGDNVIAVMEGGKANYYEVADPLFLRAMQSLPRSVNQNVLLRQLRNIRTFSQYTVTFSPDFMARNIARDQVMALAMSKHGYRPFVDAARGLRHRMTQDPVYQEFLANGGALSGFWSHEAAIRDRLSMHYEKHGVVYETIVNTPKKALLFVEKIADATEMMTRLGNFERAISKSEKIPTAAYEAREVSADFGMRGDSKALGALYDTVMFLKAGVVGMDRVYRGMGTDRTKKWAWGVTGGIAAGSLFLHAYNRGNPLYDDQEDWFRDSHWSAYVPNQGYFDFVDQHGRDPETVPEARGLYEQFHFPKPWEIGGIASISERWLDAILEGQPLEAAEHTLKIMRDQFRLDFLPAAIRPSFDVFVTNRHSYFDTPIETPSMEGLPAWARSGVRTPEYLRDLGTDVLRHLPKGTYPSPTQINALIRGHLNAWAGYGTMLADAALYDDNPEIPTDQTPGLKSFYSSTKAPRSKYVTEFYDMVEEAVRARRAMREMERQVRPDLADEIGESQENAAYAQITRARNTVNKIRQDLGRVRNTSDLTELRQLVLDMAADPQHRIVANRVQRSLDWHNVSGLKRRLIEMLINERQDLMRETVQDIEQQRKVE